MATAIFNTEHGQMWVAKCSRCATPFAMSAAVYYAAMERREDYSFYCPNGHAQHYITGETEATKLRRERDQLKQSIAYEQDRTREERDGRLAAERRASAAKGQVTRIKRRAAAGVCPCCNRTFQNLAQHMSGQHPGFLAEADGETK